MEDADIKFIAISAIIIFFFLAVVSPIINHDTVYKLSNIGSSITGKMSVGGPPPPVTENNQISINFKTIIIILSSFLVLLIVLFSFIFHKRRSEIKKIENE